MSRSAWDLTGVYLHGPYHYAIIYFIIQHITLSYKLYHFEPYFYSIDIKFAYFSQG
jgi:hypothetical protein